jgi:hypothetical protein
MIDKFLKIAGVNNIDDFYKLHPTEEHFFKSYPNARKQMDKKLSQAAYGGYYANGGYYQDGGGIMGTVREAQRRIYEEVMANAMERAEAAKLLNAPKESVSVEKAKAYQKMLNDKYGAGLAVDGIIGKNTKKAIEKFINYKKEAPIKTPTRYASQKDYGMMTRPSEMGQLEEGTDITPLPTIMSNDRIRGMRLNQQQPYSYPVEPETDLMPLPTVMGNEGYGNGMRMGQPQMEEVPRQNRIYRGRPANPQYDEETYRMGGYYQNDGGDNGGVTGGGSGRQMYQDGGYDGGGETDQRQQAMQIIQTYAEVQGQDPQELQAEWEKLQPDEQQAAIQRMLKELQQGQLQLGENEQQAFARGGMTMGVREAARHIMRRGGYYQMGGEAQEQPQQEMQESPQMQGQEQAMGQEQPQQGGGGQEQMMQQLAQMVAQALQQGMPPEKIMQLLIKQGVPKEVAMQVIQMVMQQMQGGQGGGPGQQYQPQGGQYQGPQGQPPMAAMGGYYANGGINNPGFRALPSYVQQKIMNNMAYGGHYDNGGYFNESYMPFDY